jgi:hypothetical protein
MTTTSAGVLPWAPRVLGILVGILLSLFALDAFDDGKPFVQAFLDFVIHLAPATLVLVIVAVSWQREWIGGTAFVALAVAYATIVANRLEWILVISGPLFIVGLLFLWSWRHRRQRHATT